MNKWFRVTFSTSRSSSVGAMMRLLVDLPVATPEAAEATVLGKFPDATKIETRLVSRAERRRRKKVKRRLTSAGDVK